LGHALVIADWTGKMLEQNVERMFMLSLDHNPIYAFVQYVNEGASLAKPRVHPQAYAYSIYPREFGETMISNNAASAPSNPFLTPDNKKDPYKQLAVYSSIRKGSSPGQDTLRIIAINRSQTNSVLLNLQTDGTSGGRRIKGAPSTAPAKYGYRRLTSAHVYDSNRGLAADAPDKIRWEPDLNQVPWQWDSYSTGIKGAGLPPASVNLFIIPLQ
jgi:hypothetical protein